VTFSEEAADDLERLFDFILERELDSDTGDLELPARAIKSAVRFLEHSPFACRKIGDSPFVREMVISFGSAGYVALYEILGNEIVIGAIRHQREDDFH
jgi:plasmid stabilization system protein ParE